MKAQGPGHFEPFPDYQKPMVTVLSCKDSRVYSHAISSDPGKVKAFAEECLKAVPR